MNEQPPRRRGRLLTLVLLLALPVGGLTQAQRIQDAIRLAGYEAPAEVAQLARETSMSNEGEKLFYVNHPIVANRASFNQYCRSRGEQTIVLGCYHGKDRGIYLFDVNDPRLTGVEQVTAAHEMLHAAYDRLSRSERTRIDGLLQDYYKTKVTDQRLRETIAAYEKSEPNDVVNEMHSIFATEVAELPAELETYYTRYFVNRKQVVAYADRYQQEFTARRDQVAGYDRRLSALRESMNANRTALDRQEVEIVAERQRLEELRQAGEVGAYNASVVGFNTRIERYNALIATTQAQVREYNEIVGIRNSLALEVKELAASINSNLTPLQQ
ncbi:MAG TPA: hypothetical protein VK983_05070 [Candidatus Limnocylindrales bacterium]|nr:hypothetical protein [Candidatus Limnocylindrales bacterium]